MPVQAQNIPFPAAGVIRRFSYASSPVEGPTPTPWSVNVRLEDSLSKRLRGGYWAASTAEAIPQSEIEYLEDGDGNRITDGAGNDLFVSSNPSVVSSGGRVFVAAANGPASIATEAMYRGRLFRPDGSVIHASRQGDYGDWDYTADVSDPSRPFLFQLSEAGEVGSNPTALIPHKDAFMLAGTSDSLWVITGDPAANGTLRNLSRGVGVVAPRAWCKDHLDRVYFLSSHGLYTISASGEALTAISENAIPEELTGVSDAGTVLTYSHGDRGIHIEIPTADVSWFFDTERQGFWPYDTGTTDSHLLLGPIKLGGIDQPGVINTIHGMMAAGSQEVSWRIVTGETAEEAAADGKAAITAAIASSSFSSYVKYSGTWEAGRSLTFRPRVRGMWACLWLHSEGEWAYERVTMQVATAGAWRD